MSQAELAGRLGHEDVIVIDCRFILGSPQAGRELYMIDHIAGSYYLDLEQDLSGDIKIHGGRHPLPDLGEFSMKLSQLGIDHTKWVVAYDDQGGAIASRLWWMLHFLGHERTLILDRGYQTWKSAGLPISHEIPQAVSNVFSPRVIRHMLASIEEVKSKQHQPGVVLIDSRETKRYQGIEEPIDHVAGHIPGALNYFWKDVLTSEGSWKLTDDLQQHFTALSPTSEIIVYCGSGVTACPNVVALTQAGFEHVKLYAGSWSDWISYPDNPVGTRS